MDSRSETDDELHRRIRQQEVVTELGRRTLETDDIDRVMRDAASAVAETLDTEYAAVLEVLPGDDRARFRRGVGWSDERVGSVAIATDLDSQAGYTLHSEGPVIVDDLRTETRFDADALAEQGIVSGIGVRIGSAEDPWGVLGTHATDRREFTCHDANFVQSVANVLATAIENERARRELEDIYGRITDAFYALDEEWTFTHANDRAEELIDLGGDGLVGERVWEEFEWAADSKLREEYERAMETQDPTSFELYYPDPLDSWYEIHAYPSATGLSVYFRDVTERKEREQQLEQYRALTEAASDVIVTIDETSTIRSVNPAVADVFGYRPAELEGESLTTLIPDRFVGDYRDGLARYLETDDRILDWDYVELPGRHADGSEISLAISFSETEYDDEQYFTGIVRDITERKEHERELELFRTLVDHSTDSVLVIDPETGRYLDVNDTACRRRGYSRSELCQLTVPDLQTEIDDRAAWRAFVERLKAETQTTFRGEHRRKDGTTYPVEINATYVELGRDTAYVLSIARDVTERRRRKRELEESERRYRTLAENFPNGIVTLFDADLEYTLAAGRAFEYLPVDPDDVEGNTVREAWDEATADALEPNLRSVLAGKATVVELSYAGREWVIHAVPVADESGAVYAGLAMTQDVTERTEYQRKLEERERQLSALMDNVPGMVYRCRNERGWPMEFVSDACKDVTGYDPEALERCDVEWGADVMVQEDREMLWQTVHEAAAKGETFSETYRIETADGELRWVRDYGRGIYDEDGELVDIEGIISDITEQVERKRRLEVVIEQLEESNERLEQFAYAASHDLQEPLRMISSYLRLIESRYRDDLDADGEEFFAYAVDGADRMREMIEGLLEYSRVDTQGAPIEPTDLNGVLEDALDNLQVRIEETDADVATESLPRVEGDARQLRQVFQNLLSNAIEYAGDDPPRIRVGAERDGRRWTISVRDEGIGIDSDDVGRVFDVFQRLHSHEEHAGTGIGLALCQRIVERHGGDIRIESEPGDGTTVSFTLRPANESDA